MTETNNDTPNPAPISIVTKHIKIYSDNPIHDAIDRIVDSCACIDEGDDYMGLASIELRAATEDLLVLACQNLIQLQRKRERSMNEQNPN